MMTPPTALTYATDRSISAMSSTKTTPIAIVVMPDICRRRLMKLRSPKKTGFWIPKIRAMTMRPTMMGSEPRSPALTRIHQPRA